ncbi:hypothetical protein TOPH_06970 [Tolypocladium ophioglossoides CBS 100239]|uniref:Malate dehydrogenase n=1 Tax=Tolypocladium ophioglossoides (strain CBS 100239) TaxID=1163406 RepID=A0A0L0N2X7_TOLOC|nr:hypothetical protein TOPH_06970 [Tolypocladium ophioglossoides CBS 100239]
MLTTPYFLFAAAALVAAAPLSCGATGQSPVLPKTGTGNDLPAPPANVALKYIALGFGIQNYTCAQVGAAANATGALAMLYDITSLYPGQGARSLSQPDFDALTARALWSHDVPLNLNESTEGHVDPESPGASLTQPFPPDAPLELHGIKPLPFLGHHFFNSNGVPTFVLDGGKIYLPAAKLNAVDAPKSANPGPQGTGAVSWLYLGRKDSTAIGAEYVYRVLTAGGASHGCSKAAGQDSTSYAATYWFYG